MALNKTRSKTLIIQNLQGIGDTCWFVRHYHAIAGASASKKVSILTRPRSMADQILRYDPSIENVLWLQIKKGDHDGWLGTWRLAQLLKQHQVDSVWILHSRSLRYALACRLAGIKDIRGPGIGLQKWLLTTPPFLDNLEQKMHPILRGTKLLEKHGLFLHESLPLSVGKTEEQWAKNLLSSLPKPCIGIGLSSSEAHKKWPWGHYKDLAEMIWKKGGGSFFILGGPQETEEANRLEVALKEQSIPCMAITNQPITGTLALIKHLAFVVGNDTGILHAAPQVGSKGLVLLGRAQVPIHHYGAVEGIHLDPQERVHENSSNDMDQLFPQRVFEKITSLGWLF